ncbi:MerR family transcriptional regulator [Levilactobacillus sp. N40-8-2]|uniref:MerR family transcriptional regulator n=1 Tax=Levilactobacillus muriae TaxID=3238987 RepID=UPI0038B233CC
MTSTPAHSNHERLSYPIGKFATLNKISARMLRHYDKIGLFKPQTVLQNGYRYYSSEQIPTLSLIKKYQVCGFTLAEISKLLGASDATIRDLAEKKQRQLRQQDVAQAQASTFLSNLLGQGPAPFPNDDVIAVTHQPARQLCREPPIDDSAVDASFDQLYHTLESAHVRPEGLSLLLCDPDANDAAYRVAVPLSHSNIPSGLVSQTLPAGTYISTVHYGSYADLGVAYDRLIQYAHQQNRSLAMPFIERYFLDQAYTTNVNDYITEISVQMTP